MQMNSKSENKFDALRLQQATLHSMSSEQKTPAKVLAEFVAGEASQIPRNKPTVVRDNADLEEFK